MSVTIKQKENRKKLNKKRENKRNNNNNDQKRRNSYTFGFKRSAIRHFKITQSKTNTSQNLGKFNLMKF